MGDVLETEPDTGRVLHMGGLTRHRRGPAAARDLEYAVVDVETTGLDPREGARVCEIAVVRMRGDGAVLSEFSTLVDPGVPLGGQEFHGIGASDVVGAPKAAELVDVLAELFSGAVVTGHNLDFEGRFLAAELHPAGLPGELPGLCTLRALRAQVDLPRYSLPRASHALGGHWPTAQHTALGDARACAQLLAELLANAPGPLHYTGPEPRPLEFPRRQRAVGKTRTPWSGPEGVRAARANPERPPASWPPRWRELELDFRSCGGRFDADQRAAAERAAGQRALARDALAGAAVLTGVLAAAGAVRQAERGLRRIARRG
ncbi:3'-5' exonuclease [Streptomonospora sp. S1-112]|uniref:3'-5' exonuclease n=1 Tax=Streptomonospora mangrovi TaxID=2883123 RepID=A0A9X3NH10_9ACTN|nr:3'-5' exonuclease [Streptomonospora mangrovi]MDA0562885.1 3'-5' exonuclease [Streptomonospora mangrovi]